MRTMLMLTVAAAGLAAAVPAAAQTGSEQQRFDAAQQRFDREMQVYRDELDRYRAAVSRGGYRRAPDPRYADPRYDDEWRDESGYDPARYYRSGPSYRERVLAADERVYSGYDGRYYCKRSDGTTGLVVGGAAGGILGNVIDGGRSRVVGTLLGGAIGALAGREVERNQSEIRCR